MDGARHGAGRTERADAVQVLWCDLSPHLARAKTLLGELGPQERSRAARLVRPRDHDVYVARRAWRRRELGHALAVAPERLRFCEEPGAPQLLDFDVHLSTACSAGVAVMAVSRAQRVGVDLERHDPALMVGEEGFAFLPAGFDPVRRLSGDRRVTAFFDRWTEMEARGKLRGDGLPGVAAAREPPGPEHVRFLPVLPGFSAALATSAPPTAVRLREAPL